MTTIASVLARSDVFDSLDEVELAALAAGSRERTYGPGEIVFLRGDEGESMYVVASGRIAVSLASVDGRDLLLAILRPGQSFGELAVVDEGPRVATVTARERSVLIVVPRGLVANLIVRRPGVATALLRSLATMVRRLDEQACDALLLDLPRRVEKYLVAVATRHNGIPVPRDDGFVPVDLPLTQTDLARQIGGSRQQVNRILMELEAAGSISRLGHRVVGVRPELLFSDS